VHLHVRKPFWLRKLHAKQGSFAAVLLIDCGGLSFIDWKLHGAVEHTHSWPAHKLHLCSY
jgi:hypothetical protein